jgi:hypothetical protein
MVAYLILPALCIASVAVLVRNTIESVPRLETMIKKTLGRASRAVTCGFCFTYWLAFFYVWFFGSPHRYFTFSFRLFDLIFQWLILAFVAVVFRFGYVAIQELVNYQVHQLNVKRFHHHDDSDQNTPR